MRPSVRPRWIAPGFRSSGCDDTYINHYIHHALRCGSRPSASSTYKDLHHWGGETRCERKYLTHDANRNGYNAPPGATLLIDHLIRAQVRPVRPIRHETARVDELPESIDRR